MGIFHIISVIVWQYKRLKDKYSGINSKRVADKRSLQVVKNSNSRLQVAGLTIDVSVQL